MVTVVVVIVALKIGPSLNAHAMYKRQVTTLLCCVLVHHGPHCPGLLLLKIKDRQQFYDGCCFCVDKGESLLLKCFTDHSIEQRESQAITFFLAPSS